MGRGPRTGHIGYTSDRAPGSYFVAGRSAAKRKTGRAEGSAAPGFLKSGWFLVGVLLLAAGIGFGQLLAQVRVLAAADFVQLVHFFGLQRPDLGEGRLLVRGVLGLVGRF